MPISNSIYYRLLLSVSALGLLLAGTFALGFVASSHLKTVSSVEIRQTYLRQKGNAAPEVREGVLAALRGFQEGYSRRNPRELEAFMRRLFPQSEDVLLLGTDSAEWIRGYRAVGDFIRSDWQYWGDFRFEVEKSIIWSSGDVAWVASIGSVHGARSDRPVRFSAILTRTSDRWLFRHVHFQWDERDPRPVDLFRPSMHVRMTKLLFQYLCAAWAIL
jgi:ketosteroid isomerase-like protein